MKEIKDYLPYYIGQQVITPDGIGILVGLPWTISSNDSVNVHFGKNMIKTKNSIDGGYDKTRNHGRYLISAQRLEPIGSSGITSDGFDLPGGVKPILRPLSSMTKEDEKFIWSFAPDYYKKPFNESLKDDASITMYLLSKGYDLFGLIDAGLAIDKTKES